MLVNVLSEIGLVRKDNEDSYLVSLERGLFVVADGMGGHAGGRMASTMAVKIIDSEILAVDSQENARDMLVKALTKANNLIMEMGTEEEYQGMGTTVTAAVFYEDKLHVAHIGDSRAYLFREGGIQLLTQDHSLVNELFQKGGLTLEEAQNHPQRNILTRALGTNEDPQIDLLDMSVETGDILLLCTDGLYNQVSDEEILAIIANDNILQEKVEEMINLALERGGNDNITVILVQYE